MYLIFASQNQNKVRELKSILPKNLLIKSLSEVGFYDDIPETASTIEGNSLLKAQTIYDMLYRRKGFGPRGPSAG